MIPKSVHPLMAITVHSIHKDIPILIEPLTKSVINHLE